MKLGLNVVILGLILLSRGLMAEQSHQPLSQNWITIKDKETGLLADFPHNPLEMTFDIPFQNTPPTGQVHIYSVPTQHGLLVLSIFHSTAIHSNELDKEQVQQFFETTLVPHFFFNPAVFQEHQEYHFQIFELDGQEAASFQFSFQDHGVMKKLEGLALVKNQTLYIPFYLASEKDFDQEVFNQFLGSIQFPTNR